MVGFGDDKGVTLTVATSTSMQVANADYICDGAADDVEINAALNALPAAGGKPDGGDGRPEQDQFQGS